jgi:hypothetical protein
VEGVADFESGEAYREAHEVRGAGRGERQQMPAGLQHAQAFVPRGGRGHEPVPGTAHEAAAPIVGDVGAVAGEPRGQGFGDDAVVEVGKPVGRVADDGVDAGVGDGGEDVQHFAEVEDHVGVGVVRAGMGWVSPRFRSMVIFSWFV